MKNNTTIIAVAAVVIIAAFTGGTYYYKQNQKQKALEAVQHREQMMVREHSPTLGKQNAPVEIVEFLDPECGTCARFYPFVKSLLSEFPGEIKLVVRYAAFHKNSVFAIKILEAARKQGKYWQTMELLYKHQPQWGNHQNPNPEFIWTVLPEISGLDIKRIRAELDDPAVMKIIAQDMEDIKQLDVKATPTFYVNKKPLPSFGYDQLRSAVLSAIQ